ncbi:SDR family oxidoreductase [Actinacidiphila bryophytorum]|uniref:Short-chain dehydrogenase/reductase n=1 Tax=Actinacidiphila bryophytorum TaxID=1436133 RepID=A0A9W4H355_9ACTN|nr:SDR family oxidoreductase [Actinacidiphila bryophytorum]MBM9437171.1 SDR family oxidoreductase [Actinacidiphila bryophytorum]MBN6542446.1 SDR family oxidoreductase [Actinacidiphila bryophytorum]CAG7646970.1 Short-chain dehydrogenase/reductase [Actinacidiphila bryophytorum]
MKTVLITGTSSGYGRETARHFHAQGWNVVATMRTPRPDLLPVSDRLRVLALDVTQPESITAAFEAAGPVDALVNNAGVPEMGVFEGTPMARVREVFETNTFGVMAVTQAVLGQFRERGSGVVVNVTSSVVLGHMPLTAVYKASKAAVEGFTSSLALELAPFGVRARTVEPGACLTTNFAATALGGGPLEDLVPAPYAAFAKDAMDGVSRQAEFTRESDVAETVWRAVHDTTGQLRFPAGPDAVRLAEAR